MPAPIAAHIIQRESFRWRVEQCMQACQLEETSADIRYCACTRILLAAAREVRGLLLRHDL
eukprot:919949-Pyramimonas_sp.AAC.1